VGLAATLLRGGSWNGDHINARAVYRNNNHPADRNNNIGFRVVVVLRPTPQSLFNGLAARAAGGPLPLMLIFLSHIFLSRSD
jgi:hypothetical protein